MKRLMFIVGSAILSLAHASDNNAVWNRTYKPLVATYSIYSGDLALLAACVEA